MIAKILFLLAALFTQEVILLNTLFLLVHQGIYSVVLIAILLIIATAVDIVAGYLELPFWESQAYNFFGNLLSIVFLWYAVGSITSLFKNMYVACAVVIGVTLLVLFCIKKNEI